MKMNAQWEADRWIRKGGLLGFLNQFCLLDAVGLTWPVCSILSVVMSDQQWRVLDGQGNEQGPYSFQDLQGFYTTGNINHETMIWTEGLQNWVPAGQVEGLLPPVPQVVALPEAAPVAQAQPAQVGGINLSPQIGGMTNPTLVDTSSNPIPGWISWSTILIGIVSLVLYLMPWTSMSIDSSVYGKEGQVEIFSQSGIQTVARKYTLNPEFLIMPLVMVGYPEKQAAAMADEMIAEEMGKEPPFGRSSLALTTLIFAGVGLLLAFVGYAAQNKYFFLGAQVLFIVGAGLLYVQTAREFPAIAAMKTEMKKGMQEAISEGEAEAEAVKAKAEKALEELKGEEGDDEELAENADGDGTEEETEEKEGEEEVAEAEAEEEATEAEDAEEATKKEALAKQEADKKEAEAQAAKVFDEKIQAKVEPACYTAMIFLALSAVILLVMMTRSGKPKSTIKQPLMSSQPQPQPGGFRLQ